MTKNNLVEKVLSGVKNFAGKTFLYTSLIAAPLIYSSNANAQAPKDKFVEGAKVNVISPSGGLLEGETIKAHGNWYFVVDDKENKSNPLGVVLAHAESSDRIGSYSAGNIRFKPNLYFTPEQAKDSSETVAGRIELKEEGAFAVDGKETKEIIEKADAKGGGTLFVTKIGNQELLVPLNAMTLNGKQYFMPYLASEKDSAVAKGKKTNFASIPLVDKEGNSTNQIVEYDGDVSLANPNDIYSWKLDESKSTKEIIENSELLKKLIVKNGYPASEENILQTGECKKFLQYNEEEKAAPEEKTPSDINGRIKVGAGVTVPSGFTAEINPQVQLSEKTFLGPYVSFSNSSRSLEDVTKEDGFRQVVSVPAQMYFVSTGTEIKENTKITNNAGAGLIFSYKLSPNVEAFIKAGFINQKTEKTMTSSGEEYMEVDGVKDQASVQSFDETNTSVTNKNSIYVGAGAEYSPLKGKILKNISLFGEAGYLIGSGAMGSLGIKYNLNKSNKENKEDLQK